MAKKSSKKRTASKVVSLTIFILIAIFAIVCYFNPTLYNKILSMLNIGDLSLLDDINRDDYPANEERYMKVHFIDIGQGDSILIELPDSKIMLIDAGDNKNDNNTKLITYISELGITQLDYVVATHADADHIGGMTDIFYHFEVKKVFRPYVLYDGDDYDFENNYNKGAKEYSQDSLTYGKFLNDVLNEEYKIDGVTKECEWEFFDYTSDFGGNVIYEGETSTYTVDFLTPFKLSEMDYEDANDYSPLIKVSYCDFDMLFTGDAETDAEHDFVVEYSKNADYRAHVDVELLKVSHHGSETSSTQAFLDLIKPEMAVISCGTDNSYDHPHQGVLDRLFDSNCRELYRTDKNGDIVLTIERTGEYAFDTIKDSSDNFVAPERD